MGKIADKKSDNKLLSEIGWNTVEDMIKIATYKFMNKTMITKTPENLYEQITNYPDKITKTKI